MKTLMAISAVVLTTACSSSRKQVTTYNVQTTNVETLKLETVDDIQYAIQLVYTAYAAATNEVKFNRLANDEIDDSYLAKAEKLSERLKLANLTDYQKLALQSYAADYKDLVASANTYLASTVDIDQQNTAKSTDTAGSKDIDKLLDDYDEMYERLLTLYKASKEDSDVEILYRYNEYYQKVLDIAEQSDKLKDKMTVAQAKRLYDINMRFSEAMLQMD